MSDYVKVIGYIYRLDEPKEKILEIANKINQKNDGDDGKLYFYESNDELAKDWRLSSDENSKAIGFKKIIDDDYGVADVYSIVSLDNLNKELNTLKSFVETNDLGIEINPKNLKFFTMLYYNCCESPLTFVDDEE